MILNKSVIIEHFINGTKKALGLLSYIVFNKKEKLMTIKIKKYIHHHHYNPDRTVGEYHF